MSDAPTGDWLVETGAGWGHALLGDLVTLGRDPRASIVLLDATISRRHAALQRDGGAWRLSVHGTTGASLNGARVEAMSPIGDGDILEIGTRRFMFVRGVLPDGTVPAPLGVALPDDPLLLRTTASIPAIDARVYAEAIARASWGDAEGGTPTGRLVRTPETGGIRSPWAWVSGIAVVVGLAALLILGRH